MQLSPPPFDHVARIRPLSSDPAADRRMRRSIASGEIARLRAGVADVGTLVERTGPSASAVPRWKTEHAAALDRILAVALTRRRQVVFSHASAAAIWGLPAVGPPLRDVDVLEPPDTARRSKRGVRVHRLESSAGDVVPWGGFAVTSFERTLADAARDLPAWRSLPLLDEALAEAGEASQAEELRQRVLAIARRGAAVRGIRRAEFVIGFADGRAASPGESVTRLLLHEFGCPAPTLQRRHLVALPFARQAFTDFEWPELMRILEFDGMRKYFDLEMLQGMDPREALAREKQREDALRQQGFTVIRAVWDDLRVPSRLHAKLAAAGIPLARRATPPAPLW